MRMWMYPVRLLCRNHLLGEHFELHKFRHMFVEKRDVSIRMDRNQIFPEFMKVRHDEIAQEMLDRGYNHSSPYEQPDVGYCYGR